MTSRRAAAPPLIIVAASARALAVSASRAGWSVHAADLYADADLRAVAAAAVRVPTGPDLPWPLGVASSVERFPVAPWCYGGALENHPDLVDRLSRHRPLAGNAGDRLRAVRDPAALAAGVRAAGLEFPATFADPAAVPGDGSFLVKPRRSGGGRGIARWRGGTPPAGDRVWQRFVPGRPVSAAFVIGAGGTRLLGASRQLAGRRWCGARGHAWCGAIDVPVAALATAPRAALERLGAVLADGFGLVGLVGADVVLDSSGTIHVIEVNPRPTASMELVERATGESMAAAHLAACGIRAPGVPATGRSPVTGVRWAKAVVFTDRAVTIGAPLAAALARRADGWTGADGGWPALADLPVAGATVAAGGPVLTVFAAARDAVAALRVLHERAAVVRALLRGADVSPPCAVEPPPRPPRDNTP